MQFKSIKFFFAMFLVFLFPEFSQSANFSDITSTNLPAILDYSIGAVAVDIENDGDFDIFVANNGQDRLLLNNGSGVFSDSTSTRLPQDTDDSHGAAAGDVDGDGDIDIFVANNGINKLLINNGAGVFTNLGTTWLPQVTRFYTSEAFGDIDGDGDLDLVVSASSLSKSNAIRVLINNSMTNFVDETSSRLIGSNSLVTQKLILADFDRDGDLDILAINSLEQPNRLLRNGGTGIFTEDTTGIIPSDTNSSNSAALADIDNDGKIDYIFIANDGGQQNRLYVFNSSTSKFEDNTSTKLPVDSDYSFDAAFGDLDKDGDLDIVVANGEGSGTANKVYMNDGTGNFTIAAPAFFPQGTDFSAAVLIKNFDGNAGNEVFIANEFYQQNRLYSAEEIPTAITLSSFIAEIRGGKVVLKWETGTEIDNISFNILRSEKEDGNYVRINRRLIPAISSATSGASYEFKDRNAKPGRTFFYKLEDINRNGKSTLHGPESVTVNFKKKGKK
ncbi:MAG: hypothetical protein A3C43_11820 [Candidatus Schekmanbacteria bacterium RIFCSPHIGHO2_02_FULL_38_11]|uniref:Fibronectin type-III domain-containing protein n=1 Tax=Candidatus Schekmanbacteria bacterium RIFCSPLOWO2_12_FULL_38_15 TaxID=1817883 RepID=A0A1F7SGH2_9BACT|nr:MAG: hypothetical protein A2043_10760 [Candidatus Schekmanbacteria bacterium GWA2_38_9]OGL49363.1 MAG: hypothetical protein A3H37_06765 [Candidatus Schekmanbacteria bacterium RIFCSPLOWO2_02_FULL_38_14]OGL50546.1 MAG: hypothetical protein A3C43_11820 [Candidatus Schekmanbacteria bacterium RIFCSPHIGHO2_02_FULL_38_11]OGL52841.1 MAG: hypothetical protein A3G31_00385 [Candidatus Schekmanbacteria bacterium RIFCSPLOWO2_12_FULL_38_15]